MMNRRSLVEFLAVISVLFLCLATIAALVEADTRRVRESSLGQHQNVTTKLQARISLESRNLDIDNEKSVNTNGFDKNGESHLPVPATIRQQPQETKRNKNTKRKRERSERKLSNLWSMFLPGSSSSVSESDYEDNGSVGSDESSEDGGDGSEVVGATGVPGVTIASNNSNNLESKSKPLAEMGNFESISSVDEHSDERSILAKYSRPPRQDGANSTSSIGSNSNAAVIGRGSGDHQSGGTNRVPSTTNDGSPASTSGLITGALSKDIGANPNDGAPNTTNGTLSVDSLGLNEMGEREDDDRPSVNVRGNNINNRTSTSADNNFERWLNRIQFQEPPSQSGTTPTSNSIGDSQPSHKNQNYINQARPAAGPNRSDPNLTPSEALGGTKTMELTRLADGSAEVRMRQQQQQLRNGKLGNQRPRASPMSLINSQRLALIQQQQIKVDEHIAHQSKFQHPFQQQLKQNQAQLIQGIKYPMVAQASTISVSTQDGTSNTSLSFTPTTNTTGSSSNNEISPTMATTQQTQTQSPGAGNEESQPVQQQVVQEYHSQDEILRQVTSAINFEQQLSNKKPARPDGSNHRKPGESLGTSSSSSSSEEVESPESISKLFKIGSSINEFVGTPPPANTQTQATTTTTISPMDLLKASMSTGNGASSGGSNRNNSMIGTNDLDKNLDMLAEKLRLLVTQRSQQQQQQQTNPQPNGSQPSWLRRPDPVAAINQANKDLLLAGGGQANLTSAQLANLMNVSGSNNSGAPSSGSLEKLRDLLSKHEKNKNELKSSQETMNLLLQQLMQDDAEKSQSNRDDNKTQQQTFHNNRQLVRGESNVASNLPGQQQQVDRIPNGITNIGWTPLTNGALVPAQLHQAVSPGLPANLIKGSGRFKKPPMRISQMLDNSLGPVGGGSDAFAGGDYNMNDLAMMLAGGHPSEEANELLASHKILGVPVAFLKEEEEEQAAQFEAAAKHLAGHEGRQLLNLRPAKNQIAQRLASSPSSSQISVGHHQKLPSLASHHLGHIERIKGGSHPLQVLANNGETSNMEAMAGPFSNSGQLLVRGSATPIEAEQYLHQPHNQYASLLQEHAHHHQQENQNPFVQSYGHTQNSIAESQVLPDSLAGSQDILMEKQQQQHHGKMGTAATVGVEQQRVPINQEQAQQVVVQQVAAATPGDPETTQTQSAAAQQQKQISAAAGLISSHHNTPNSHAYQTKLPGGGGGAGSVGLGQEMSQLVGSQRLAPLAVLGAGTTPIRYREVSIYRPFGYQSHHAIAYQASPTVAALFPGLAQGSPRPSLLRQMSPFRSRFQENHRLMGGASPLSMGAGQSASESMRQQQRQHQHQHSALPMGQVRFQSAYQASPLPITAVRQHYIRFGGSGGSNQVKRQSNLAPIRESWPPTSPAAKLKHRLPYLSQQTKMKPRHLNDIQPPRPPIEFGDSLMEVTDDEDTDLFGQNLETLNYMPMDSAVKSSTIEAGQVQMVQQQQQQNSTRPTMPGAENKSRPSRQPDNFRQQRGPKWETMMTRDKLRFSQQQRNQLQAASFRPATKSCITSQPQGASLTQMPLSTLKPTSFAITQTPTTTPTTTTSAYSASSNKPPPATAIDATATATASASTQTTPLAISTSSNRHHPAAGVSSTSKPVVADQQQALAAANSTRTEPM